MATQTTTTAQSTASRWLIAAAGAVVMLAIGGVYAWSVFVEPLQEQFGWSRSQATLPYMVLHGLIFVGTFGGGRLQDRIGPRPVALAGIALYATGVALASLTSSPDQLWLLVATYGVLGGVGLGLAYIVPPAMLSKWFPDKRGVANGIAVGGFGGGALIAAPIGERLADTFGSVPPVFLALGLGYLAVGVAAALFLKDPPEGYEAPARKGDGDGGDSEEVHFRLGEALRTPQFYLLTTMFTLSVIVGNAVISQASPLAQEVTGADAGAAAALVGLLGIANAAGRPGWASLSDAVGRMRVFQIMLPLSALVFLLLPMTDSLLLFGLLAAVVILNYGGAFGTMPSVATDLYGTRNGGAIYGAMVVAWSIGGVVGPLTIAQVRSQTGSFTPALYGFAAVALVALVLASVVKPPSRG